MENQSDDIPLNPLIGIVYNLKREQVNASVPDQDAEYDSMDTVLALQRVIENHGLRTALYEADASLPQRLMENPPALVFNIAEGRTGRGREAQAPAIMNLLGIPFTGSDETTLCIALDKALTKRLLSTYHIKTPHYLVAEPGAPLHLGTLHYPVIVKPNAEGSSKGISEVCIAPSAVELKRLVNDTIKAYGESMLIEEYLDGREFTVGILGNGSDIRVFPPMEIVYSRNTQGDFKVYSYHVKQNYKDYITYRCPPDLPDQILRKMTDAAKRVFTVLGCRDYARVDFRLDKDGMPCFIEINPLPGMAPNYSDFPMLAEFSGVSYETLVMAMLKAGASRYGIHL